MSYQQQGGYAQVPGLSVGAIPLHYANASDGDHPGEYGETANGSSGSNGGPQQFDPSSFQYLPSSYSSGGSSSGFGALLQKIRSNRPLSLGIGFFFLMLFLVGGGGGKDGKAASTSTSTTVTTTPMIGGDVVVAGGGTSRFSGSGGGSSSNSSSSNNNDDGSDSSTGNEKTNQENDTGTNQKATASVDKSTTSSTSSGEIPRGITWLAYFPLSGAYYVSLVVRALSVPTGTNYNSQQSQDSRKPIFQESPQGPFERGVFRGTNEGDGTVVVSTHCGGTCPLSMASFTSHAICQPSEFVETVLSFDEACRRTYYWNKNDQKEEVGLYDSKYVEQMIHLIRDPFANVVSMSRVGINNVTGFHAACEASSKAAQAGTTRFIPDDIKAAMEGVPCSYEFFQYVQWHNLALEEAEYRQLKTLAVYYEDFGHQQDAIVKSVADFVGVPESSKRRGEVPKFLRARMYDDYYTDEQRKTVWKLVETIAFPKTLELLQRYRS